MAGPPSKRQQARNERALQELIKTVPGNNVCADCQARNPGWASWSLGIFICMRCAALHRKLGTHITKVKSLSMDSWSNEQVEHMKRVGNIASNRIYNPQNTRIPIPVDADEADSAMERFIRKKYMERAAPAQTRMNTGSSNSDDQPPPLPPKPGGSRFGFRSASSIFPLSSKARREAAARPDSRDRSPPPSRSKQSRGYGTNDGADASDLESKLAKLRDMGFRDEKKNATVLKGLGGNMEKAIESLVRLGEGGGIPRSGDASGTASRSRTPISPAGLSFDRTLDSSSPASNNPFDIRNKPAPPPPQSSQSTGSAPQQLMGNNPYQQTSNPNPFGLAPSQSQYNLNQAFQNMAVSNSQPLFPHHTGGFPGQQQSQQQQAMVPPVPSLPQQSHPPVIYENPSQPPQQNYNPFLQQQSTQSPQAPPINTNFQSNAFQSNPYAQQSASQQGTPLNTTFQPNPFLQQNILNQNYVQSPAEQNRAAYFANGAHQQQQQQQQPQANPFFQNNQQQMSPQMQQPYNQQFQPQNPLQNQFQQYRGATLPLMPQPTGKADKKSILDLYNYPQLAPTPLPQSQEYSQQPMSAVSVPDLTQQRSVSSPISAPAGGSRNRFMTSGAGAVDTLGNLPQFPNTRTAGRHVSQESVDAGGWQSGRHSPDAWGQISGRSMR